ncbi:MAG: phage holin family protein [Acidimicrobiia bacterium]|nr:phage holin family protein [Acidimicrobiia bacterium]
MIRFALRVVINAAGLWVADRLLDGITLADEITTILLVALVFGVVNALVRPIALVLSLPALILTLGLFTLVVNAAMLALTAWLTDGLAIDGFGAAFLGAIIITLISWILSSVLIDDND